jgi:hypothetical protein
MKNDQKLFPFDAGFPPIEFPPSVAILFEPADLQHLIFIELALCDALAVRQARRLRENEEKAQ